MNRMGVSGTARVSLAFYNKREEIDLLVASLDEARRRFGS
jgi:selenocysteine lyase/cysteine desulfurase